MAGVIHLPVYATGFHGDDLEAALAQLAPISTRYGSSRYEVFRSRDDRYKFLMTIVFDAHHDWDRFWFGEEFTDFRAACSGWFQVPLLYSWHDLVSYGELREPVGAGDELES